MIKSKVHHKEVDRQYIVSLFARLPASTQSGEIISFDDV